MKWVIFTLSTYFIDYNQCIVTKKLLKPIYSYGKPRDKTSKCLWFAQEYNESTLFWWLGWSDRGCESPLTDNMAAGVCYWYSVNALLQTSCLDPASGVNIDGRHGNICTGGWQCPGLSINGNLTNGDVALWNWKIMVGFLKHQKAFLIYFELHCLSW